MMQAHRRHLSIPRRYIRLHFSNFAKDRKDHIGQRSSESKRESHPWSTLKRSIKRYEYYADTLDVFPLITNEPEFQCCDLIVELAPIV